MVNGIGTFLVSNMVAYNRVLNLQPAMRATDPEAQHMRGAKHEHLVPCYFPNADKNMAEFARLPALALVRRMWCRKYSIILIRSCYRQF